MIEYQGLLRKVYTTGQDRGDRTGVGTRSLFGERLTFDLQAGFPLVTTKEMYWKGIVHELLWFLSGSTNVEYLQENGVKIWNEWADDDGELGPVYGKQWRDWNEGMVGRYHQKGIDQIANVIESLKEKPLSRRHIVSAWNPSDVDDMALPPCHMMFQFYAREMPLARRMDIAEYAVIHGGEVGTLSDSDIDQFHDDLDEAGVPRYWLDCQMYQRSADLLLGVPFNIASYSLLTHMVAQVVGMVPGRFIHVFGDAHIYKNHFEQVETQLAREPYTRPSLDLDPSVRHIDEFTYDDINLVGYESHPKIKAPIAV